MLGQESSFGNNAMARLGSQPGTYALIMSASRERRVDIGKLGQLMVRPGFYVYVGSAFGPGGLRARVLRHCRKKKRRHWHIDYLGAVTRIEEVWYTCEEARRECRWAAVLARMRGASVPMMGFGASDCRCASHLYFCECHPSRAAFSRRVRELLPGDVPVRRLVPHDK